MSEENKVRVWFIGTIIECHERNLRCPTDFVSEDSYLVLKSENEKLKKENKKLREGLEQFADFSNPNPPERVCWPANITMKDARKFLDEADKIEG